ncbi:MAG: YbaK/EbsC family protein [Anaerolineae bacterium]|nr:YbaK/EbsC family protein [Anaerolineae bacterium]
MEPLTPEHVQAALDALDAGVTVRTFETSTATAQDAADSIGTTLGSIVKSLCFIIDEAQPVVVLCAGDRQIDTRKLAALYDVGRKKVKMATAEESIEITGYVLGGVPPVGHRTPMPVYIDATLSRFETVYAAAGSPNAIFPIRFDALVEITGGVVADLVKD